MNDRKCLLYYYLIGSYKPFTTQKVKKQTNYPKCTNKHEDSQSAEY